MFLPADGTVGVHQIPNQIGLRHPSSATFPRQVPSVGAKSAHPLQVLFAVLQAHLLSACTSEHRPFQERLQSRQAMKHP